MGSVEISQVATRAVAAAGLMSRSVEQALQIATPLAVAAELRRLARVHAAPPRMWPPYSRSDLLRRADVLDPEGLTRD